MPIFPPRVEFVGVDVSTRGGTLPAQACTPWVIAKTCWYSGCVSVYWLWPILCTINSQFLASDFCTLQYYRSWLFTASWQSVDTVGPGRIWRHLKIYIGWSMYQAIWFYHQAGHFTYSVFLLWLCWCLLQPRDDAASVSAAQDYQDGKSFSFMRPCRRYFIQYTSALAKLVATNLGCTLTLVKVSRETLVLTSIGSISLLNGFLGYRLLRCQIYLVYEGSNPAIIRLQMRLMCWDDNIVYQPDTELVDSDYWSRIGVDFEYDPLYAQYLQQTRQLRKLHPVTVPMLPENMPYYRGLQFQPPADAAAVEASHAQTLLTATVTPVSVSHNTLCIMRIRFGLYPNAAVYQALLLSV